MSFVTINTELPSELNYVLNKNKKLITDVILVIRLAFILIQTIGIIVL